MKRLAVPSAFLTIKGQAQLLAGFTQSVNATAHDVNFKDGLWLHIDVEAAGVVSESLRRQYPSTDDRKGRKRKQEKQEN